MKQHLTLGLIMVGVLASVSLLQVEQLNRLIDSTRASTSSPSAFTHQMQQSQLRLSVLKRSPALGYRNVVADGVFLGFLQYFGDQPARQATGYRVSPDFFEVIVKNDPRFWQPYLFLSTSTSIFAGLPERSVDLMAQGLSVMTPETPPESYQVWRYKAIDELLFLGDGQAAQQSFATAADWASQHSTPEAQESARVSRDTANFLAKNPQSRSAQISAWVSVLVNAVDQQTQKIAIQRIQALGGTILVNEQGQVTVQYKVDD